jgi:NAD(P)-dependent dehydrogenase (short-subunit alcohol dehydrogenase family)
MTQPRVAIVTAAGQGIGAACARALAAEGWRVGLMARSDGATRLAGELGGVGVEGSVTEAKDIERLVAATIEAFGGIDGAVVSTGHAGHSLKPTGTGYDPTFAGNLLDIADQAWHDTLDLYVLTAVRVARALTPHLIARGGGAIVNVSASGAVEPHAAYALSSALRRSLSAFMKLYADRYARERIRMNNILPGFIENFDWSDAITDAIPLGRAGSLAEVGATAAFLLGPGAGYITGQDVIVDGGARRGV